MTESERSRPDAPGPDRRKNLPLMVDRLKVGMDVFLEALPEDHDATRQRAALRGWDPGRFVLITRDASDCGAYLRRDQACTIRFFTEGEAWGFQTKVLSNTVCAEDRVIRVAWPDVAERARVRDDDRVRLDVPVRVRVEHEGVKEGRLLDLSAGGCRACVKADYLLAAPAYLSFLVPGGHRLDEQLAIVRSRRKTEHGSVFGFQFRGMAAADRTGLALFAARRQAALRGEVSPHPQVVICTPTQEDARFARELLHPRGYEVLHAVTLIELGRLLDAERTALLLVDTKQAPVSARQVCVAVKQDQDTRGIPVAVYGEATSSDDEPEPGTCDTRIRLLRDGADLLSSLR